MGSSSAYDGGGRWLEKTFLVSETSNSDITLPKAWSVVRLGSPGPRFGACGDDKGPGGGRWESLEPARGACPLH